MNSKNVLRYGLYAYGSFVIIAFMAQINGMPLGDQYEGDFQQKFWTLYSGLPLWQKLSGTFIFGVSSIITLLITYTLSKAVAVRKFLDMATEFTKIAHYFIAYTIWGLLSEPFYSLLATAHMPKGQRFLSVNINSHHLKWFLMALFFYFLVEQMKKAYLIEKEQEMTV